MIVGSIAWSAVVSYLVIMRKGFARLDDPRLLFIDLELRTMIGIYFKTSTLPVRFVVYVAITALTRCLTVDVKDLPVNGLLAVAGAILMLALSALALDYGIWCSPWLASLRWIKYLSEAGFSLADEGRYGGQCPLATSGR